MLTKHKFLGQHLWCAMNTLTLKIDPMIFSRCFKIVFRLAAAANDLMMTYSRAIANFSGFLQLGAPSRKWAGIFKEKNKYRDKV